MFRRTGQNYRGPQANISSRDNTTRDPKHGPRKTESAPVYMAAVFIGLLALRIINALTVNTFFQPDEYYQSLEPALVSAFGPNVNAWITWEWREGLRSSLHPLLFASVYRFVDNASSAFSLNTEFQADLLVAAPKVVQGIFAALTDVYTYRLACDLYEPGASEALAALALTVVSPWQWFASARTLSNSLETTLTIIGLRLLPWKWLLENDKKDLTAGGILNHRLYGALLAAALACILRPTNLIVWVTVSAVVVLRRGGLSATLKLVPSALICGSAVLALSIAADRSFYGAFVVPAVRFVQFNVVQSLAVFYGQNRPDYYVTEGLPLLLTTALPFAALGIWKALRPLLQPASYPPASQTTKFALAAATIISIAVLSLISHKEVRFIFPLLPMLHILAAEPYAAFFHPFPRPRSKLRSALFILGIGINLAIMYYTANFHQRGVIDIMHYLRHENEKRFNVAAESYQPISIGFLMPCHSTPWRSHLVYPEISAWALTCEPPLYLTMAEREVYLDEADVFYADPVAWIRDNMRDTNKIGTHLDGSSNETSGEGRAWPEYVVFFEQLEPMIKDVLAGTKYRECWRGFNTHWHDDWRRHGDVIAWCYQDPANV